MRGGITETVTGIICFGEAAVSGTRSVIYISENGIEELSINQTTSNENNYISVVKGSILIAAYCNRSSFDSGLQKYGDKGSAGIYYVSDNFYFKDGM